ncbi:MAG: hypothetical protein LBQ54_02725, partial [Planctomycetaceae bacterium]|nr:hypothetical protein [Planctomycetaceae bacterium]
MVPSDSFRLPTREFVLIFSKLRLFWGRFEPVVTESRPFSTQQSEKTLGKGELYRNKRELGGCKRE